MSLGGVRADALEDGVGGHTEDGEDALDRGHRAARPERVAAPAHDEDRPGTLVRGRRLAEYVAPRPVRLAAVEQRS